MYLFNLSYKILKVVTKKNKNKNQIDDQLRLV